MTLPSLLLLWGVCMLPVLVFYQLSGPQLLLIALLVLGLVLIIT